ncbi:CEG1 [Sanghuangporus vaninii]
MPHTPRIPDIPGDLLDPAFSDNLRRIVAQLCQTSHTRFPGSQPVSFAKRDLERLENEDYWVCEKSDGVRVLFLLLTSPDGAQDIYLIDRHNNYRVISGFFFPHHADPKKPLGSTIIDGELVIDTDARTGQDTLRLLAFDCLVVDYQNVMSRTLDKRYGRLQEWFFKPFRKMMQDHPYMAQSQPFDIKVKPMELSYGVEKVFNEVIPKLQHGNDGLIYTCLQSPYVVGTDPKILKWKPPSENTIDFKLVLRFPPDPYNQQEPDFTAKPIFGLHAYIGGRDNYEPFDELYVDDDEWERLKVSGDQVDDRIAEVYWETREKRWRLMRFRDDKPHGNHKSVVDNIIQSIVDGVEKEDLLARKDAIRSAWKARAGQPSAPVPPSQQASSRSHQHPPPPPVRGPMPNGPSSRPPPPAPSSHHIDLRYGPLQESPYSRVGGPTTVLGFHR